MLFYDNLEKIIFHRHEMFKCDELVIISGYLGPQPVHQLMNLPFKVTVIYGMYGCDGVRESLHNALVKENEILDNVTILYSTLPVHAKCYIWKNKGEVVHALVGSANFSTNGIKTPFKEVLAETTVDTFDPLDEYTKRIMTYAINCKMATVNKNLKKSVKTTNKKYDPDICSMPLYIIENGKPFIPEKSGINWGMAKKTGSHVNINDAYIRIGADLVEHYPKLFPAKQSHPASLDKVVRKDHRHNDSIDILWDDGTVMTGLLEGSITKVENGVKVLYPKQIATTPRKALLGEYIRGRLGVPEGEAITINDLKRYGRATIDVSLQGEGIYYFDFSVSRHVEEIEYVLNQNNSLKVADGIKSYNKK